MKKFIAKYFKKFYFHLLVLNNIYVKKMLDVL